MTLLLATLCVGLAIAWIRERRYTTSKVNFLLDAVSSGDYAFKFSDNRPHSLRSNGINAALNRMAQIMLDARNEALERERYYELIINQVTTAILIADDHGNILQCNEASRRLLGLPILTHVQQLARVDESLGKTIANVIPGEKRHTAFLNERGNVELSVRAAAATLKGKAVRIIALSDINSELDDNQMEAWNKLIRVLTHEIMNTVTPIASLSKTLLEKVGAARPPSTDTTELATGLEIINKTSTELTSFVENYRKLTHLPTPVPRLFYVRDFALQMKRVAQEMPQADGIGIDVSVEPEDLLVYADENLITHVVGNLLKNAIQAIAFSGEGSHIGIHAYSNETEAVVIDIENDGPIIPPDLAQHIFVPFFTTKADGSGIGLSVCRQIMKLSRGTISLKTDNQRHLTTFQLVFD